MQTKKEECNPTKWERVKSLLRSGNLKSNTIRILYHEKNISFDLDDKDTNSEGKDGRSNLPNDKSTPKNAVFTKTNTLDYGVEEFMAEMMSTISEMHSNRSDSVKKIKGIIKKNFSRDSSGNLFVQNGEQKRNRVHFSEENIIILIPRPPVSIYQLLLDCCGYYCCFGYLFPHS